MATLQKIRNRAGVLVTVIIGFALFAFILGDMLNSGNTIFKSRQMEVANINGESVQYQDFQKQIDQLGEIYKMNSGKNQVDEETWNQIRDQVWQTNLHDALLKGIYKKLGISVSSEEMYDMVQGKNVNPVIQRLFTNPQTGQFDKSAVIRFLKSLESNATQAQKNYWLYLEKSISDERAQTKYTNLVKKGLYVTHQEAQQGLSEKNNVVDFKYVPLLYTSVADNEVSVNESDLKKYYDTHQQEFKQQSSRRIEYVVFPITPSLKDNQDAQKWVEDIKTEFKEAADNVQFVNSNSDISFDDKWYKKDDVPAGLKAWFNESNPQVSDVYGPYLESGAYKLAKINKIEMRPDSVQARHILLTVSSQAEYPAKKALADSLKNVIEKGGNFAALARLYSTDQGSAIKGGDLGFFKYEAMVKPFADAAFGLKEGGVTVANSQFGIHIIQTTKRGVETKQVQFAILARNVVYSDVTYQKIYAEVSKFASDNSTKALFDVAVVRQKLDKKSAALNDNDRTIEGLTNPRALIRAAFEAKKGDILVDFKGSSIFELGNNFVIANLVEVNPEGIAPFSGARARIELEVVKEKKAELLAKRASDELKRGSDLYVIAQDLKSEVKSAENVNFTSYSIPGLGAEPALLGAATSLASGKVSSPVKGNNGVYIVQVTNQTKGADNNILAEQQALGQNLEYRIEYQAFDAVKNAGKIVDKRSKFY
jgi:peptidyl-prolyl cis-trans isomerase D